MAAEVAEAGPLPEPAKVKLTEPGGICYQTENTFPWLDELTGVTAIVDPELGRDVELENSTDFAREYSGTVLSLLDRVPAAAAQHFNPELGNDLSAKWLRRYMEGYPAVASFAAGGETHFVAGRTRSLGLRPGMHFEARTLSRNNGGFSWDRILTIRSRGETVLHHAQGAILPQELDLPGGLRAEHAEILCSVDQFLDGDMYSMRVSNDEGDSIVLEPGQARTLGDFDVYLWAALYPSAGQRALAGIDTPSSIVEIAAVRRP